VTAIKEAVPVRAPSGPAIVAAGLTHRYRERVALDDVGFTVAPRTITGFLGPNGGGKSTLFRILATLLPPTEGSVELLGLDPGRDVAAVRRRIGVVFQSPGLDPMLTVRENLVHQGHLYGLRGAEAKRRIAAAAARLGLTDRLRDRTAALSGGLRRRVEIAKALLHEPELLLLDEPSTGLDPAARMELWTHLRHLVRDRGVTVVLTTHLMEEAEACDVVTLLDRGRIVGSGSPETLVGGIGGDAVTIDADDPEAVVRAMSDRFGVEARVAAGAVHLESGDGAELAGRILEQLGSAVRGVRVGKPGLADVFLRLTGRAFQDAEEPPAADARKGRR
jgi:ABC-2 type transport system ATP-binding protein